MKKTFLILGFSLLVLSCDNNDSPSAPENNEIQIQSSTGNMNFFALEYSKDGSISEVTTIGEGGDLCYYTYRYTPGKIVVKTRDLHLTDLHGIEFVDTLTVVNGLVTESVSYRLANRETQLRHRYTYQYDNNRMVSFCMTESDEEPEFVMLKGELFWDDQNISKIVLSNIDENKDVYYTRSFSYNADLTNTHPFMTIFHLHDSFTYLQLKGYFGQQPLNVVAQETFELVGEPVSEKIAIMYPNCVLSYTYTTETVDDQLLVASYYTKVDTKVISYNVDHETSIVWSK